MQPVKAEPKVDNPQSKGMIAENYQPVNQSFGAYQPGAPPLYGSSQSYNQQQVNQTSAPSAENHTSDYTDEVERQAVEEENALDAEAEKDVVGLHEVHHKDLYEGDESQQETEFGDLSNPSNPLFGKYDVPASPKKSPFCPPCGKSYILTDRVAESHRKVFNCLELIRTE